MMLSKRLPFSAGDAFPRLLLYLRMLFRSQGTPSRGTHRDQYRMPSRAVNALGHSPSLPPEINLSPTNNTTPSEAQFVGAVQNLKPFLPNGCEMLGQGDLRIVGSRPINAGGFANVWDGELTDDGTRVAIKSHRYYSSSSCLPIYLRLFKEALTCSHLKDNDKIFVPFVGVYSTEEHPFALVFKFMGHQDLREYLRNNQDIGRLELLLEIACGLKYMHSLGIVHGNIRTTNILVDGDGHVRIAGLGAASVLSIMPAVNIDRSFPGAAPELIDPQLWGLTDTGATVASDVYAFAVLAWEVFAGRPPFSGESVVSGVHSMFNGRRPGRPDHPELSDRVWKMIKECWRCDPAKRRTFTEIVTILKAEATARE